MAWFNWDLMTMRQNELVTKYNHDQDDDQIIIMILIIMIMIMSTMMMIMMMMIIMIMITRLPLQAQRQDYVGGSRLPLSTPSSLSPCHPVLRRCSPVTGIFFFFFFLSFFSCPEQL